MNSTALEYFLGEGVEAFSTRREVDETFALSCSWTPGIAGVTIITIK